VAASSGLTQYELTYAINPILLVGGAAGPTPGATVPLMTYLQGSNFASLLSQGNAGFNLDDSFAYFQPIPGSTLIANQLGAYPFANQATAANAIITQPLNVSLMMIVPVREAGGYTLKNAAMTNLQALLAAHVLAGGTFTVCTPSFVYTTCILVRLADVSGGETHQVQWRWQWDFQKPLISLADAEQAYNGLMGRLAAGTQVSPNGNGVISPSGPNNLVGNSAAPAASTIPASQSNPAGSTGGFTTAPSGDAGIGTAF
jgi:hypothetical protein